MLTSTLAGVCVAVALAPVLFAIVFFICRRACRKGKEVDREDLPECKGAGGADEATTPDPECEGCKGCES